MRGVVCQLSARGFKSDRRGTAAAPELGFGQKP